MKIAPLVICLAVAGCTCAAPTAGDYALPVPPVPPASVSTTKHVLRPRLSVPDIQRAAIEYAASPDATAAGIAAYRILLNNAR